MLISNYKKIDEISAHKLNIILSSIASKETKDTKYIKIDNYDKYVTITYLSDTPINTFTEFAYDNYMKRFVHKINNESLLKYGSIVYIMIKEDFDKFLESLKGYANE